MATNNNMHGFIGESIILKIKNFMQLAEVKQIYKLTWNSLNYTL